MLLSVLEVINLTARAEPVEARIKGHVLIVPGYHQLDRCDSFLSMIKTIEFHVYEEQFEMSRLPLKIFPI